MAIGLGRMFGCVFAKNVDSPDRAEANTDVGRRWHISLSTFLRDYLYIPLGGNQVAPVRAAINLVIVMFLGGLWHGAAWTFVVWGLLHGSYLVVDRVCRALFETTRWANNVAPRALAGWPLWPPRFTDETQGWAVTSTGMAAKLLRTTDGDRWREVGTIQEHYTDIAFTSATDGVLAAGTRSAPVQDPVLARSVSRSRAEGHTSDIQSRQ